MQRIFCSSEDVKGQRIMISDKVLAHHLKNVLRLKEGEKIEACDERRNLYFSIIEKMDARNIALKVIIRKASGQLPAFNLTIACAIPKKSRFEDIVDKLTQIGVDRIIPLMTKRVIVKIDEKKERTRIQRWRKIALSAATQSHRTTVPVIEGVTGIKELLAESVNFDLKLIPYLGPGRKTIKEALYGSSAKNILVLIGPEGDFTPEEVSRALKAGFIPVSLGALVLRVETAAVSAASFIKLNEFN